MRPDPAFRDTLTAYWRDCLLKPAPSGAVAQAHTIVDALPAGSVVGILFHGSCLEEGPGPDRMADYYVLLRGWQAAFPDKRSDYWAAAILPPLVRLVSWDVGPAKISLLALDQFDRGMTSFLPTLWARFAQPSRLVWGEVDAVAPLLAKGSRHFRRTLPDCADNPWQRGLAASYGCEWRAERTCRAQQLVTTATEHYAALHHLTDNISTEPWGAWRWRGRRWAGRAAHLVRLCAASLTVVGGLDYLAWKIERHSGRPVPLAPWMRRVPILAGLCLLILLRWRGQVR